MTSRLSATARGTGRLNICVFCGAKAGTAPHMIDQARVLGESLAKAGFGIVYGAGGVGMMGALSEGALRVGGHVTGIIPQSLMDREFGRTDLPDLRVVATMPERKALMYELSAAFITLPGGLGTLEEFFETVTWSQLGLHAKPSFVLDLGGYYTPLRELLDHAHRSGFLDQKDRDLVTFVNSVEELIVALTGATPSLA